MNAVNVYINFVLYAVYGKMAEADALMRVGAEEIRRVADGLARAFPITSRPLYRGVLLDPSVPFVADPKLTFLSWSEDRDVAAWFACTRSAVSAYVAECRPHYRGYMIEAATAPARVLFHHAWAEAFHGLSHLAHHHPHMGAEGARQIAWSLKTQQEVITDPADGLQPQLVDEIDADTLLALERKLSPPWLVAEEGLRS